MRLYARSGFTLIELMVSITIIMILSAIVLANLSGGSARGRDLDRQADLRALQTAIENYKRDHGRYPAMGCFTDYTTDADNFSSEEDCENYISNATMINGVAEPFVPNYIDRLPRDPRRDAGEQGFAYITNPTGTVYKIMVMRTVESERVTYTHPFRSCAVNANSSGGYPNVRPNPNMAELNTQGWCAYVHYTDFDNQTKQGGLNDCIWQGETRNQFQPDEGQGNYRFDTSYGLWGGFEPLSADTTLPLRRRVAETTKVICE